MLEKWVRSLKARTWRRFFRAWAKAGQRGKKHAGFVAFGIPTVARNEWKTGWIKTRIGGWIHKLLCKLLCLEKGPKILEGRNHSNLPNEHPASYHMQITGCRNLKQDEPRRGRLQFQSSASASASASCYVFPLPNIPQYCFNKMWPWGNFTVLGLEIEYVHLADLISLSLISSASFQTMKIISGSCSEQCTRCAIEYLVNPRIPLVIADQLHGITFMCFPCLLWLE